MSSTTKRRSTDSRINAANNGPSTPATESQDRKPAAGDDKKAEDVTCLGNGVVPPTKPPNADDAPLSPKTPLANTLMTIILPSSPPSTSSSPAPTDPAARASPLDGLRSSRNSLTSSRPAPPSPVASRRTSGALSRCSSTRSRPNSTPATTLLTPNTNADSGAATSPTTPTSHQQARKPCSTASVKIRDFAFPDDDPRHTGLGPLTPRPNRRLQRPLSAWSNASSTSSNDDDAEDDGGDPAGSSMGGGAAAYGFAGWGLGRLSWFGVRTPDTAASAASASTPSASAPSQGDFVRNFEDAVSPSYEIDDPYASLNGDDDDDDDDDFDDYEDGVGGLPGEDGIERPLVPGLYRALYAFEPEGTAEMALEEDQIVRVVGRGGGVGWAIVARGDDEGHALVPEGYLELVSLDQDQQQQPGEEEG